MPVALITGVGKLPETLGVAAGTSDHADPFHWLPNTTGVGEALNPVPSASHRVVETHETDDSTAPPVTLDGITGLAKVHVVPFHVSATAPKLDVPTAMQNARPTQDTESSSSPLVDGTLALGTTAHDDPFHCSTSVPPPAPLSCWPTATQKNDVVQETAFNTFDPDADAAFALDQFVAPTVGALVWPPARAEDPIAPTVSATRTPATAIIDVRQLLIAPP